MKKLDYFCGNCAWYGTSPVKVEGKSGVVIVCPACGMELAFHIKEKEE